jgi:hypothetical protein
MYELLPVDLNSRVMAGSARLHAVRALIEHAATVDKVRRAAALERALPRRVLNDELAFIVRSALTRNAILMSLMCIV